MPKYTELNDWLFEEGLEKPRIEQLLEDMKPEDIGDYARLLVWIGNAFDAGRAQND